MAMSFMCQKSFHPNSKANQKAVWIAQQKAKKYEETKRERERQLREEQEQLNSSGSDPRSGEISFLYKPPPGFMNVQPKKQETEAQTPQSIRDELPYLKNAPTEGEYTKDIEIRHNPFGVEYRLVKCARCGIRGHRSTERECPMRNQNPNDEFHKEVEDPLQVMTKIRTEEWKQGSLNIRETIANERRGNVKSDASNQTFVTSDDEGIDLDPKELIANFTPKQRRRLLKAMRQQAKEEKKKRKKEEKRNKEKWVEKPSLESKDNISETRDSDIRNTYSSSSRDNDRDRISRRDRSRDRYKSRDSDRYNRSRDSDRYNRSRDSDSHYRSRECDSQSRSYYREKVHRYDDRYDDDQYHSRR